jgi:hypothetical protein
LVQFSMKGIEAIPPRRVRCVTGGLLDTCERNGSLAGTLPQTHRDAMSDSVKPGANPGSRIEIFNSTDQDEERGLGYVVNVSRVVQDARGRSPNRAHVATDLFGERILVAVIPVTDQQVGILGVLTDKTANDVLCTMAGHQPS